LVAGVVTLCLVFGWWQNQEVRLGGAISTAKSLWLATALGCFFVIPWTWWRDPALGASFRRLAGVFLAGFLGRALIEAPVLVFSNAWRCWHGMAHDAIMLGWIAVAGWRLPPPADGIESAARRGLPLVGVAIVFEMLNAWLFQGVARPQEGVYFASHDARFALINRLTWMELALLWPLLVFWVLQYALSPRVKQAPAGEGAWI
jgi:hypothetical protein